MQNNCASQRVQRIKPSPSGAAADRASDLKREGRPIISLVVGEPDFDTPAHICQAGCEAIMKGDTRYTHGRGTMALREAVARKLKRENGLEYGAQEIIVTAGAKAAIYLALGATLNPGDEVIVPAPHWVSYTDMTLACDGVPVVVACPESSGFKITPDQLEAAITPRTRWLMINSPCNPTGATYSAREYAALADVLRRHPQVLLMTDEIYEHLYYGAEPIVHPLIVAPDLRDRTLIVNGVSKSYAMTGWRIGYIAGPADLMRAINVLKSQAAGATASMSQAAAVAALDGDQSFVAQSREIFKTRRDATVRLLNEIPGLSCRTPDGAFYLYVNCAALIGKRTPAGAVLNNDDAVVMYMLETENVALVAGSAYGLSPYFRMSIATSMENLQEGCKRIARAIAALQ